MNPSDMRSFHRSRLLAFRFSNWETSQARCGTENGRRILEKNFNPLERDIIYRPLLNFVWILDSNRSLEPSQVLRCPVECNQLSPPVWSWSSKSVEENKKLWGLSKDYSLFHSAFVTRRMDEPRRSILKVSIMRITSILSSIFVREEKGPSIDIMNPRRDTVAGLAFTDSVWKKIHFVTSIPKKWLYCLDFIHSRSIRRKLEIYRSVCSGSERGNQERNALFNHVECL